MPKIYIVTVHTGTLLSLIIKKYSSASYSHASISLDPELKTMYSFGRKKPRNPFIGGFVTEGINSGLYDLKQNTTCSVYSIDVSFDQYKKIQELINSFEKNEQQYKYDLLGLLKLAIKMPRKKENKFFCSCFVAKVLEEGNVVQFNKPYYTVKPDDFISIPNLKLEYQGLLKYYKKNVA